MLRAKNEWHFYCFIAHGPNITRARHGKQAERRSMPTVEVAVCIWLQLWRIPASCFRARSLVVGAPPLAGAESFQGLRYPPGPLPMG